MKFAFHICALYSFKCYRFHVYLSISSTKMHPKSYNWMQHSISTSSKFCLHSLLLLSLNKILFGHMRLNTADNEPIQWRWLYKIYINFKRSRLWPTIQCCKLQYYFIISAFLYRNRIRQAKPSKNRRNLLISVCTLQESAYNVVEWMTTMQNAHQTSCKTYNVFTA